MRKASLAAVAAALCIHAAAFAASYEILEDDWLIVRLEGQPVGRGRMTTARRGDRILTNLKVVFAFTRMGVPIQIEMHQRYLEDVNGRPLSFDSDQRSSVQNVSVSGRIEGGKVRLRSETMGRERTRTLDWPEHAILPFEAERRARAWLIGERPAPGDELAFTTFSTELDRFTDITFRVVGPAIFEGQPVTEVQVHGLMPGVVPREFRDSRGRAVREVTDMMGMSMEIVRASREESAAEAGAPKELDIMTSTLVELDRRIARQFEVENAVYRVKVKKGAVADIDLGGPGMSVRLSGDPREAVLTIESVRDPAKPEPMPIPVTDDESFASYLKPSTFMQSDDPALAATAVLVTEGARDSLDAARRLERWVFENVTEKGFDLGLATASEVFRDRAGDCTEHAVLLGAMLRAAGIPSRVATGLIYFQNEPGSYQMFYHMWNDAWVGEWVPLDATLAGPFVDACHVRLGTSDLAGFSAEAGLLALIPAMGNIGLEVIEYQIAGRRVDPSPPYLRIDGERAVVGDFGVSLNIPMGWTAREGRAAGEILRMESPGGAAVALSVDALPPALGASAAVSMQIAGTSAFRRASREDGFLGELPATVLAGEGVRAVAAFRQGTVYILTGEALGEEDAVFDRIAASFRME